MEHFRNGNAQTLPQSWQPHRTPPIWFGALDQHQDKPENADATSKRRGRPHKAVDSLLTAAGFPLATTLTLSNVSKSVFVAFSDGHSSTSLLLDNDVELVPQLTGAGLAEGNLPVVRVASPEQFETTIVGNFYGGLSIADSAIAVVRDTFDLNHAQCLLAGIPATARKPGRFGW